MPIRNAPAELPTTLRFLSSRLARRLRGEKLLKNEPCLRQQVEQLVPAQSDHLAGHQWMRIPANAQDWMDSGIELKTGESFSLICGGSIRLSERLDVGLHAQSALWYRVGDEGLARVPSNRSTFTAQQSGLLKLLARFPGDFLDQSGAADPDQPKPKLSGELEVLILRWKENATEAGLKAAADMAPDVFAQALERLQQPKTPPQGWKYFWRIGEAEIYQPGTDDGESKDGQICCNTHADVGIAQYPVDIAIDDSTRLEWSWLVKQLPSKIAEHTQPTHDYLSIAIEFDNGLDLTYMWSVSLPVGTIFQCPLPWWDQRETHWVIRSGTQELGQWLDESRPVADDYRAAIGDEVPERVVAVWLIANSAFQRGTGECVYSKIRLSNRDKQTGIGA